jgi:hypothetical protein
MHYFIYEVDMKNVQSQIDKISRSLYEEGKVGKSAKNKKNK